MLLGCDLNQSELIVEVAKLKEIQKKNTDNVFSACRQVSYND